MFSEFMSELNIRKATLADVNLISALAITTHYEAYFELDPSHDLADYCINFFNLETVKSELENPKQTYFIVEFQGNAVGFFLLREGKKIACMEGKNAIELQRIYLIEKMKGKKIGKMMIEKSGEVGREKGYETLWLGVWDKNVEAQRFYEKIGMKNVGVTDFSDGKNSFINFVFAKDI